MEFAIQICGWVVGLPLELLIIAALLGGLYRRFPFLFAYLVALFLATVVEIPASSAYYLGDRQAFRTRAWTYWLDEAALLPLIILVVLSLIWRASARIRSRRVLRVCLMAGILAAAAGSFWAHYNPRAAVIGEWMTPWTRDLYFGSAVLDLALWALLLGSHEKDRLLLALAGALGIQFTGEAMGDSIRYLAVSVFGGATPHGYAVAFVGNVLTMTANLACLYIWWRALRRFSAA
ncbi:MAG: hypothetical protein ABSC23_15775 [Bryobacteraceae bacterium]|jgi:hypothetical protein